MKRALLILALLLAPSMAWAQCTGVFPANTVCGNSTGVSTTPKAISASILSGGLNVNTTPIANGTNTYLLYNNSGILGNEQFVPLANGGLGASQAAATANSVSVFPGAGGAAVPTSATTWFDNAYCNTVGYIIVRLTGAWTCSPMTPAPVTWWGAKCDNSTNDTTNINTAIASGAMWIVIPGICRVTTLTAPPANIHISGNSPFASRIRTTSAAGDILSITNPGITIDHLGFDSTVTRTGGAYVHGSNTHYFTMLNFYMTSVGSAGIGLQLTAMGSPGDSTCAQPCSGYSIHVGRIEGTAAVTGGTGIILDGTGTNGSTGSLIDDVFITGSGTSTQLTRGIEVTSAGDITLSHIETEYAGYGLDIIPNNQEVEALYVHHSFFDSNNGDGVRVQCNGSTLGVYQLGISDSWLTTNQGEGLALITSGAGCGIQQVDLIGDTFANNHQDGVYIDDTGVNNVHIIGGAMSGNGAFSGSACGFHALSNVSHFSIVGTTIGAAGIFPGNSLYGVCLGTGNNYFTISDVDASGSNTGGPIVFGGVTGGQAHISNLVGYHDTGTNLTSCGTGSSLAGSDYGGVVTVGSGTTSCNVVFGATWISNPACTWTNLTTTRTGQGTTTTTSALSIGGFTAGDTFSYVCRPGAGN
jgi:hypothetical protein